MSNIYSMKPIQTTLTDLGIDPIADIMGKLGVNHQKLGKDPFYICKKFGELNELRNGIGAENTFVHGNVEYLYSQLNILDLRDKYIQDQ